MNVTLDRRDQTLVLTYKTADDFTGTMVLPTDPFSNFGLFVVTAPNGDRIHEDQFALRERTENIYDQVVDLTNTIVHQKQTA